MLITRECDYAVRIVRALSSGGRSCVNDICGKEELTPAFVYKILKKLEKAGIVQSFRGSNGGYALSKSPREITLLDLYLAVDDAFYMIECLDPNKPCPRDTVHAHCQVHKELCRIQQLMLDELSSKSMAEILES